MIRWYFEITQQPQLNVWFNCFLAYKIQSHDIKQKHIHHLTPWPEGHYGTQHITVTSQWARWRLKSPALRLFTQSFIQTQIKENIKAPRHWPLCGEFTGDRWIPRTNGQLRGKCFHLMTSSWHASRLPCLQVVTWYIYSDYDTPKKNHISFCTVRNYGHIIYFFWPPFNPLNVADSLS